jgi:uncharacterized protein with HEPN domain
MPPEGADAAYLWDIIDAGQAITAFIAGKTFADYEADRMLRRAVEREVEIIGEAARRLSAVFQDNHPEVPWRRIVAQRHVIAHEYGEIKHEKLWLVATQLVPELVRLLERLLPPTPPEPNS